MNDPVDLQGLLRAINQSLILAMLRSGPRHGYQIAVEAEAASDGMFTFQHGTLYPILHRLEKENLISGHWETVEGRRRKVYSLTARGRERLSDEARLIRSAFTMLTSVLEAGE